MSWTITKMCDTCEHYPNDKHCIGCTWDNGKRENTKWELKKNPIVIEREVLDKIRNEIRNEQSMDYKCHRKTYDNCLRIIDKYTEESECEK